jgi:hypothetical protein
MLLYLSSRDDFVSVFLFLLVLCNIYVSCIVHTPLRGFSSLVQVLETGLISMFVCMN